MIAGVYCNRLRIGMKLDADPTVIYPVTKGKPLGPADPAVGAQRRQRLQHLSPRRACRPGRSPIPGKASIAAVLHPAPTKALYFVADGTGGHVFADTLAEQNANVAKWYAIRRAAGADVRNRGIGRARMFMGGLLLFAAVIAWATDADDEPARQVGRVRAPSMCGPSWSRSSATARSARWSFARLSALAAVPGPPAEMARGATGRDRR